MRQKGNPPGRQPRGLRPWFPGLIGRQTRTVLWKGRMSTEIPQTGLVSTAPPDYEKKSSELCESEDTSPSAEAKPKSNGSDDDVVERTY